MSNAVVIGAGPAGSLVAFLLARSGWSVTLVEQHRFPRDKVCGECLSATGMDVLERAGLHRFPILPIELTKTMIHAADGSSCCVPLPRSMWGISRHVMDLHLLNAASGAGVRLRQPARCEDVAAGESPCVSVRNLVTNHIEQFRPSCVIVADGKPAGATRASRDFGIKTHFVGVDGPRDSIELFGVRGHYGGLAPIEGDRWNAAFSVPSARLRSAGGNVDALFAGMVRENRTLKARLRRAQRIAPWLASPLPRSPVADKWADGIIPVGNAAASMEPIGGEGMGLALRSAELAANALISAAREGIALDTEKLREDYRQLWRVRSAACRVMALAVSCAPLAAALTPLIDGCDLLTNAAMGLMGKSLTRTAV